MWKSIFRGKWKARGQEAQERVVLVRTECRPLFKKFGLEGENKERERSGTEWEGVDLGF